MALDDPLIGKTLGDYTIQRLLGRGGMSRVYQGYDENLDRYAAVKVISGDFATTTEEEYTRRFQSEARAIARLRHPNIVGVYQFGRTEGIYYMAQVFLEGKDLRSLLKEYADRHQRVPPDEVLRIIRDVGSALDYAHEQGVIHRDIKPSNIMLEKKTGRAILMDFGLALSVQEGTMGDTFGSAHYIAPEQAVSSAKAVPQSDLYSLGIVLYEMLAGRVPFDDPSVMSVALKHLNELPPPPTMYNPDLPPAVESVIMRVLDKDPKRRHATGSQLVEGLAQAFKIDKPGEAADVKDSPAVVDMLDSKTKPPVPWWQQQAEPLEHPRPSSSTAAKMREQETGGTGGLAQRFARRKERKEEEAALQSITEESLQLDEGSLDSLLDSMPDPSEIGLVGEGAAGITGSERPSGLSRPSAPGVVVKKQRRSRVGILLPVILVLALLAGGLYLGGQFGIGDDNGNAKDATLTGAEQSQTAAALAAANETETPAMPTVEPSKMPTTTVTGKPTETPTEESTEEPEHTGSVTQASVTPVGETKTPTIEATQTSTDVPPATPTVAPTTTEVPSSTPTRESSPTTQPTREPTATAAPPRTAVAEAPTTHAPNIRAIYSGGEFLLLNISGETLDISKVSFEQELPDGTVRVLKTTVWNRAVVKPDRMAKNSCYQLLTGEANRIVPDTKICPFFLGYFRTSVSRNHFWVSSDPGAVFAVRFEGLGQPLAECEIAAGECEFYAGPDASQVAEAPPTLTPTSEPTETSEPVQQPNIRLIYNKDNFILINVSRKVIDISQLVFKQELTTGSERTFLAAEWDESAVLVGNTTSLRPGGCYELVTSEGTWVKPNQEDCAAFLGWFRSNIPERFFWISNQAGAVFKVQVPGDPAPLAVCEIDAGECRFYLPTTPEE
jgi:serine/threonine protein kinase